MLTIFLNTIDFLRSVARCSHRSFFVLELDNDLQKNLGKKRSLDLGFNDSKKMSLKFFDKLSQNLIELLNDKDDYNVIIEVENKKKSFTAHSNVLKFRSSYFRRELENIQTNENNVKIIIKSNISAQIFNFILQYIYGGIVDLENCETRFIYDLMLAAESALLSLLKRDDLQIEEVKIWDYVIKWGIAQTSTLPKNLEDWTKENFLALKTTLRQCLPHIRYFHLSGIEVFDKIEPYKKILDKQLWKDINQYIVAPEQPVKSIILPPRSVLVTELPPRAKESKESFSTIISEEHAAEISTWIDRKTTAYTLTDIPYKFELILRGTRDGFTPQTFWNICHGHACTVVLLKVKGTDEIVGGYNPLAYDKNTIGKWTETKDSFIFSLKMFGGDFCMSSNKSNFTLDDCCFCRINSHSYEKLLRSSSSEFFSITDYEVFKIVKKTI
ncbi:hypothetical protein Glove_217g153 [Diversispora epigaea]|uniref:BTB domain-containing protein n=1 Tax=Diversispora epigaea TaxID=1348612 RepID=A0A397IGV4_9GLOM|nr:hypothetical protein Glove_217g153 [Diversispora epigaea]